jgi:3-deoxy-D-manno-octulosonic-acid transferase
MKLKSYFLLILYKILVYIALPFAFLRLWLRGKNDIAYRQRWKERLGFFPQIPTQGAIWIHGVSLGEIVMATPLIKELIARAGDAKVVVTTMTITGSARVKQLFSDKVVHVHLPYDTPTSVKRFYNLIKPKVAIILETEIWPNYYFEARKRNIPLYIVNARISPAALKRYELVRPLIGETLNQATFIATQSSQDTERFLGLGADPKKLSRFGNLKFDLKLPENILEKGKALRAQIAPDRPVWIAASTHEGEEEVVLNLHKKILKTIPSALLILVPRHNDRFDKVAQLIQDHGLQSARRSKQDPVSDQTNVYLSDTMGEMLLMYATTDVALVCGSIKPIGGHNSLEAAALGVPVIVGQYTGNCEEVTEQLKSAGALLQFSQPEKIGDAIENLLGNSQEREKMGQAGLNVVAENSGVLEKVLKLVLTDVKP